ncbi:MAG: pyridoxal phosphate-dependent aminotransferase [Salaquimonas sp.]
MPVKFTSLTKSFPITIPFVGPETLERKSGKPYLSRIGANESVFGPSPKAIVAMETAASENWQYSDPENYDLRHALAAHHGVSPDNIVIGEGIDGLLGLAARMIVEPGVTAVMADGAYPTFAFHVANLGGTVAKVPYIDDHESITDLLAETQKLDASILYFTNPDNPMGTFWGKEAVGRLIENLPQDVALFFDEAYCEFALKDALAPIDVSNNQVIRFRTFSKAYGMAGARIGYVIAHEEIIATLNKIRNQYGINRVGQIGALAALDDQEWLEQVRQWTAEGRERIYKIAADNGLKAIPSLTNFVTVDMGRDQAYAKAVLDEINKRGIFMRMPFAAPGNRCIRVGVGKPEDLDLFEKVLREVLEEVG